MNTLSTRPELPAPPSLVSSVKSELRSLGERLRKQEGGGEWPKEIAGILCEHVAALLPAKRLWSLAEVRGQLGGFFSEVNEQKACDEHPQLFLGGVCWGLCRLSSAFWVLVRKTKGDTPGRPKSPAGSVDSATDTWDQPRLLIPATTQQMSSAIESILARVREPGDATPLQSKHLAGALSRDIGSILPQLLSGSEVLALTVPNFEDEGRPTASLGETRAFLGGVFYALANLCSAYETSVLKTWEDECARDVVPSDVQEVLAAIQYWTTSTESALCRDLPALREGKMGSPSRSRGKQYSSRNAAAPSAVEIGATLEFLTAFGFVTRRDDGPNTPYSLLEAGTEFLKERADAEPAGQWLSSSHEPIAQEESTGEALCLEFPAAACPIVPGEPVEAETRRKAGMFGSPPQEHDLKEETAGTKANVAKLKAALEAALAATSPAETAPHAP